MKPNPLKGERIRLGKTLKEVSEALGIGLSAYREKEAGVRTFTFEEIVSISKMFGFSKNQVNDCFFAGRLPVGKSSFPNMSFVHDDDDSHRTFSVKDVLWMAKTFGLSYDQVNRCFFDNELPNGNALSPTISA